MNRYLCLLALALLPGCTFYSFDNKAIRPRPAEELHDVSPAVYIVLAVFVLVAVVGFFMAATIRDERHYSDDRILSNSHRREGAMIAAIISTVIIFLLVG